MTVPPRFSILIPSRNRLSLLGSAIESVRRQSFSDWEIVVSDNASDPAYAELIRTLDDPRITLSRSEVSLSVTDNWNRAVDLSTGQYIVMLGDDDALAPGYLEAQAALIEQFDQPEVIYSAAYHYAYPAVVPGEPLGYFTSMNNSTLFRRSEPGPYLLDVAVAREMSAMALRFRHEVSFNAQHFLFSREFVAEMQRFGPLYQSPYPDYYCCFMAFMLARRIVVDAVPRIIIGISSHSFGFYFLNNNEQEGAAQFLAAVDDTHELGEVDAEVAQALRLPGSAHTRNWLIAALVARRRLADAGQAVRVDLRRYARIQLFDLAHKAGYERSASHLAFRQSLRSYSESGQRFGRQMFRLFLTLNRVRTLQRPLVSWGVRELLGQYLGPHATRVEIGSHTNVLDAIRWLERAAAPASEPVAAEQVPNPQTARQPEFATKDLAPPIGAAAPSNLQAALRNKRVLFRMLTKGLREPTLADFDPVWYAQTYPDIGASGVRPVLHFLRHGLREGRFPNAYAARFDRHWYLQSNADVAQAAVDPFEHFVMHGAAEGRAPNAQLSGFDPQAYLRDHPDVAAAGHVPLLHYLRFGMAEGRAAPLTQGKHTDAAPQGCDPDSPLSGERFRCDSSPKRGSA